MYIYWFSSETVTDADDDDDDNAGRHSTTTRATYRQVVTTTNYITATAAAAAAAAGGIEEEEESDDEESEDEESLDEPEESEESDDEEREEYDVDICPVGCSVALYNRVCNEREGRLDIEEVIAAERTTRDAVLRDVDAAKKRAKLVVDLVEAAEDELEAFQVNTHPL